jgi:hypothetical protein
MLLTFNHINLKKLPGFYLLRNIAKKYFRIVNYKIRYDEENNHEKSVSNNPFIQDEA